MKRCDNCFENNSDGATNCVICGEALVVPQAGMDGEAPAGDSSVVGSSPVGASMDEEKSALEAYEGSDIAIAIQEFAEENDESESATVLLMDDDWADDEATDTPVSGAADSCVVGTDAPEIVTDCGDPPSVVDAAIASGESSMVGGSSVVGESATAGGSSMVGGSSVVGNAAVASGTVVLQVYHDSDPRVVLTYPIVHDITLIGREDPHRDVFPDLDLGPLAKEGVSVNHVSRQHLRLLRDGDRFFLFVYKGTTGTQVCSSLIEPSQYGKRFEISLGDRIVLGGKVRMKLTTEG